MSGVRGARWRQLCCLAVLAATASAQGYDPAQPLRPETILLARIRYVMEQNLRRLPNYTCTMTIERSRRLPRTKRFQSIDAVRLEVALVSGKELYTWPGSSQFEERDLTDMVQGGAVGTGDFALHAKSVFLSNVAQFHYVGEDVLNGVPVHRFTYTVPQNLSGYRMRVQPNQGIVGYRGTVWNDATTLDLLRLEIDVHQIPPQLPVSAARSVIEYQKVDIGGSAFLLPKSSELVITDIGGEENRNRTVFSGCRQYSGESVLTFDEPPDTPGAEALPTIAWHLPAGLAINLKMRKMAPNARLAAGDPFEAVVTKSAQRKGQEWLPKGALVEGRVILFTRVSEREGLYLVGLKPDRFHFENKVGSLRVEMEIPSHTYFLGPNVARSRLAGITYPVKLERDVGYFLVQGDSFLLPSGFSMVWRTLGTLGESK